MAELLKGIRGGLFWSCLLYGLPCLLIILAHLARIGINPEKKGELEARLEEIILIPMTIVVWTGIAGLVGLLRGMELSTKKNKEDNPEDLSIAATCLAGSQSRKWRMLRSVLVGTAIGVLGIVLKILFYPEWTLQVFYEGLGIIGMGATCGWVVGLLLDGMEWLYDNSK